jgi:hypothetical protein
VSSPVYHISSICSEEFDNIRSKSKESQTFKLFLEGKKPVEVVIALDLEADVVRAVYREFWELKGMHKLNVLYEEIESLPSFLNLHKIVEEQGMSENEVINVLKSLIITNYHICKRKLNTLEPKQIIWNLKRTNVRTTY